MKNLDSKILELYANWANHINFIQNDIDCHSGGGSCGCGCSGSVSHLENILSTYQNNWYKLLNEYNDFYD